MVSRPWPVICRWLLAMLLQTSTLCAWTQGGTRRQHCTMQPWRHRPSTLFQSSSVQEDLSSTRSSPSPSVAGDGVDVVQRRRDGATIARDYIITMSSIEDDSSLGCTWSLFPINVVHFRSRHASTDGAQTALALERALGEEPLIAVPPKVELICLQNERDSLELLRRPTEKAFGMDEDFLLLLQLLQAQWMAGRGNHQEEDVAWHVSIGSSEDVFYGSLSTLDGLSSLFSEAYGNTMDLDNEEWVEMMTASNQVVGKLPRSLVHKHNVLHRGVGIFVTQDYPIKLSSMSSSTSSSFCPKLYIHRRVSTKRIFPSLYDMFVGGVSLTGEPSFVTARREVAEELNLSGNALPTSTVTAWSIHNHDDKNNALLTPEPLLTCLICTEYNRCFVDLFQYTMDTQTESVKWQEEEVAWGEFVTYDVVMAAADLSIRRFVNAGTWPGGPGYYPATDQSGNSGENSFEEDDDDVEDSWKKWDFVPDGLLVWKAWLDFLKQS